MESLAPQAQEHEASYHWREASGIYQKIIAQFPERTLQNAEIQERQAYALYRWARQAESPDEFRERANEASKLCDQARQAYDSSDIDVFRGRSLRCRAIVTYLASRSSGEALEKRRMAGEAWNLTKQSLEILARSGNPSEYARTYNDLVDLALLLANLEREYPAVERVLLDAFDLGEKSIRLLSGEFPLELSRSYVLTAGWAEAIGYVVLRDPEEQERYHQIARTYWKKATELSEETALINLAMGGPDLGLGSDESLGIRRKALEYSRKTRDKQAVGAALEGLSLHTSWKALASEDPEDATLFLKEALRYAEEAGNEYAALSHIGWGPPVLWTGSPYADYYRLLARYETDIEKRRSLLEKSVVAAPDQLKRATDSGYPNAIATAHHVFTTGLTSLAGMERGRDRKMELLEEALQHTREYNRIVQQIQPHNYWNLGEGQDEIARIKSELASLSEGTEQETRLLQEAVQAKEASLKLSREAMKWVESSGSAGLISQIASKNLEYADLLTRSHERLGDPVLVRNASKAFEDAAALYEKAGQSGRVAECYWRSAQAYELSGDNRKASDNFALASNNYKIAAEKLPQLEGLYEDLARYMQAWSEIEQARYHHGRQEYQLSKGDYEKAAELHKLTRPWSYLRDNYSAWAELESGESLSRVDRPAEAIQAFERAAVLFAGCRRTIREQIGRIKDPAESQMARHLVKASDLRKDYCRGRITVEEAKILDKKGDHLSSSEKFGSATETLSKIYESLDSENDRQEFRLIITLSRAWRLMAKAEAEDSPALYAEASKLFEEARTLSPTEKSKTLALGHSRFCKALEAATRFSQTRDAPLRTIAIESLEDAAILYVRADEPSHSEYARATKLVFEAYLYTDEASKERDLEKKSRLYLSAENLLKASVESYSRADHPEKEEQVGRLLQKTRQDRDLATSIAQVFRTPPTMSDTTAFSAPRPTHERAVGLGRFEDADLQTRTKAERKDIVMGEDLNLQVELTNAGRGQAQIVKIEELVPKGFELKDFPASYRAEGSGLNMKGKRLDPLKVEDLRLVLRPISRGRFTLKPRIVYLDENGQYKSHEPVPVDITVGEESIIGLPLLESGRRLAAIMFTDMVGYTSLSQRDEALALRLLEDHRRILRSLLPKHDGREIKTIGDSFLVEFASALEAARCALDIQRKFYEGNSALPEEKRVTLRIGIHLGDVIHTPDGDVQGDAVNVASRIEPLANPGEICVSDQVYAQIKNKIEYPIVKIGSKRLKNVQEPMEIYRVALPWTSIRTASGPSRD